MTDQNNSVVPPGWHSVTPRMVTRDARGLVEFMCYVFEATGAYHSSAPSVIQIGDSKLMISDVGERGSSAAFLYVYVADVAGVYRRAIESGATSIEAPFDTPYGDRRCMIQDKWGNTWQIAAPLRHSNAT